jgi:uncharacterized protein
VSNLPDPIHREVEITEATVAPERTIVLRAVPYNKAALVDDGEGPYFEEWAHGVFRSSVAAPHRVSLNWRHGQDALSFLGKATLLREEPDYLHAEYRVARGKVGDHVLDLVGDGALDGASIEAIPLPKGTTWGTRPDGARFAVRQRALLLGTALTPMPAYADAKVLAVREDGPVEPQGTPLLDALLAEFPHLRDRLPQ